MRGRGAVRVGCRLGPAAALVCGLALLSADAAAQAGAVLTGRALAGDSSGVPGADIVLLREGAPLRRGVTDGAGTFRFGGLEPGPYLLRATAFGYRTEERELVVEVPVTRVVLTLQVAAVEVEGIRVQGQRERARFEEEAGATVVELEGSDIQRLPGLAEADVLRAVEVLPGVISTSDFSASFNVRGGAADQNLILLDGVPIYNPFHLGGLFSVFNADMVDRAELLAGGFPARYGGRVSSVLDIRSDAGDGDFGIDAGVSILASRATVSGGLPDATAQRLGLNQLNARLSVRRSYFDVLLEPFFQFPYHLTDVQGVAQGWTDSGRWTLTAYTGEDVLDLRDTEDFPLPLRLDWGNDVIGVGWAGMLGGVELDARASASAFNTSLGFPDFDDTELRSGIGEARVGADAVVPLGRSEIGVGLHAARISYDNLAATGGTIFGQGQDKGWSTAAYLQWRWEHRHWLMELGARLDRWDPASADAWAEPSPRVAVKRFLLDGDAALKLAAGRYTQALHSLRDEDLPIGIDIWITAGERAPVVVSDQIQVGWEQFGDGWSFSAEAYYRTFDGVVTTNPADDLNDPLDDLLTGSAVSYGADLLVRRDPAPDRLVDGWLTLSLLEARRTFPEPLTAVVDDEVTYPPIYDRGIDLDLVLRYPLPGGILGGLRFNFGSGLPYTRAVGAYTYHTLRVSTGRLVPPEEPDESNEEEEEGGTAVVLGDRNGTRYPAYHRLDLSFRKTINRDWGSYTPFLDLLNVYNRRDNVLFYFYDYQVDPPVRTGISMLPILPTLGLEISF